MAFGRREAAHGQGPGQWRSCLNTCRHPHEGGKRSDYGTLVVLVPERRQQMCKADYVIDMDEFDPGTTLQARGAVTAGGEVLVCASDTHFLRTP